jgi:hypothetical protein
MAIFGGLSIAQDPRQPPRFPVFVPADDAAMQKARESEAVYQSKELSKAWEKFERAGMTFATKYNEGKGLVWPMKEAAAFEKAYEQLVKCEAWRSKSK